MSIPKILIIPARRHIAEAYCEYLVRYLGDEFWIDIGYPTIDNDSPLAKNPNDYDLIYPQFDSHWFLDEEKYKHKVINVQFEPKPGPRFDTVTACTSDAVCKVIKHDFHLRFGVDTELFKPFPQPRLDDKLHVGFIGNIQTPRRYIKELFIDPLVDLEGIKLDIYPTTWSPNTRKDEIEQMGGQTVIDNIVDGDKWFSGIPNIYNRMDVFIRCDIDHGYQFCVMEAAACGVPVICTDSGPAKEVTDAGGGICVGDPEGNWEESNLAIYAQKIQDAVIYMRDHPEERKEMGKKGRFFIERNYTWDRQIDKWREFFRYAYKKMQSL